MGEPALDPSGPYIPEPGKVAIRDLDGTVSKIPLADLNAAQGEGARPATQAEYFGAQHGTGGQVAAGLVGAARGASFGLSDPLYVEGARALAGDESADHVRNTINLLKESHADANLVGEVGGALAPALFGGGGASASAIEGEGMLARAGARVVQAAPRAVAEGVGIGLGQQLSEDTLQNHKLTAENYVTAGFKGGAIGILLGGGLSAGLGAAGDKAGALFGRRLEGVAERSAIGEEGAATRALAGDAENVGEKGYFARKLENEADIQRFKGATNAKVGDLRRLGVDAEAMEGREAELGRVLKAERTAEGLPLTGPLVTQAESAKRVAARLDEVGSSLRPIYRELDAAAERPSMNNIVTKFEESVLKPRLSTVTGEAEVGPAAAHLGKMAKLAGEHPDFEALWKFRQELDHSLSNKGAFATLPNQPVKVGTEDMRALRDLINEELLTSADRASVELGTAVGDKLRTTNALYRDLATVNKIAQHQAALISGSNIVSLTDVIAGATGGPAGFAMAGANMIRRKLGNQLAAHVLDKVSQLSSIQRAATHLDDMMSQGAKAFVAGKGGPAIRKAVPVTDAEVRELRDVVANPSAVSARVAEAVGKTTEHAPQVAAAMSASIQRTAALLGQVLPKESPPVGLSFQKRPDRPLSDTQRLQAQHVIETAKDPSIVLDRLREGRLTKAHVDTLRISSPESFLQIQNYIRTHGEELRPQLTVQQECQLGLLFNTPINAASLPANLSAFQASFTQGNQAPGGAGQGGGGPMKTPSTATAFDKMESGKS